MGIRYNLLTVSAGIVLFGAACGGSSQAAKSDSDLAFVEESEAPIEDAGPVTTFVPQDSVVELSEYEEALVAFEAAWVCDVQNLTFESNEAIPSVLEDRLAEAGIDEESYGEFRELLNQDEDLRVAVMATYQSDCSND